MAPIRRYLRISKYSVLECRIYLENPADSQWLVDSRDPVLPRVFESIRPLVLPKLREENERARAKKKSKPVKDVLTEDDFEVSIFLREAGTRHSIMTRQKTFENKPRIKSNSSKLTGTADAPVCVEAPETETRVVVEAEQPAINLQDIPENIPDEVGSRSTRIGKRKREDTPGEEETESLDEKKLALNTTFEGFSIWGWILCLIVARRDTVKAKTGSESNQALMEEWICTQAPQDYDET